MRFLIAILLICSPAVASAGHGCASRGYSGSCMADTQGDFGCSGGTVSGFYGSSGCGSSGTVEYTSPTQPSNPQVTPLPETTIQPNTSPQVPTIPAPQRQSRSYRTTFKGEIVSKEFVDVHSSTGEVYRVPIVNGYLPQRLVDAKGEIFDYSLRIPYTSEHKAMKDRLGYLTYTDSPEVRAIYTGNTMVARHP